MNRDRITRLTALRNELAEIKAPSYPNSFWSLINLWIAKATPIIRRDWNEFLEDFQKIATEPNNSRLVYHNSDFSLSKRESRRQWEIDNSETAEVKQNILAFLNGLLTLPDNRVSQKKKSSLKNKKTNLPVQVRVARYVLVGTVVAAIIGVLGTCITAYFGYMDNRTQAEASLFATQTAESKLLIAALSATPVPSATDMPTTTLAPTSTTTPLPPPLAEIFPQVDGGVKGIYKNNGGLVSDEFVRQNCVHSGSYGLQLRYDMKEDSSGGWVVSWRNSPTNYFDVFDFSAFTFWVKGILGGETFQIGLKDTSGNVVKVESETLLIVSSDWMQVTVPLSSFKEVNTRSIENVNFGFDKDDGTGSICIDDISFTP